MQKIVFQQNLQWVKQNHDKFLVVMCLVFVSFRCNTFHPGCFGQHTENLIGVNSLPVVVLKLEKVITSSFAQRVLIVSA